MGREYKQNATENVRPDEMSDAANLSEFQLRHTGCYFSLRLFGEIFSLDFSWRLCLDLKERISNRMQLREEQKAERQRKQLVNILTLFKCQTILDATYKF